MTGRVFTPLHRFTRNPLNFQPPVMFSFLTGINEAMNVVDCSLRDGGFLNGWAFSTEQTAQIITAIASSEVDFIEVGYLHDEVRTDSMGLPISALERMRAAANGRPLSAMMRASHRHPDRALRERKGLLDLIRIPCSIQQPDAALALAQHAKQIGFSVSLNLTNMSSSRPEDIRRLAKRIEGVDVVYLADSRGAIAPATIPRYIFALRSHWTGAIGFHAHNNLGWAYANTKAAIEAGCLWIDGTLAGMGLGGRNLRIDEALQLAGRNPHPSLVGAVEADWVTDVSGLPRSLYIAAAQANISQDWVQPLVRSLGESTFAWRVTELPRLHWQTPEQVALWFAEFDNLKPCVRFRVYQSQGRNHEQAEEVFFNQVKPVHERHGALFLGREVLEDGQTIVRWLYPNEPSIQRIQSLVAKDEETRRHREVRMKFGLHGVPNQEWIYPWP